MKYEVSSLKRMKPDVSREIYQTNVSMPTVELVMFTGACELSHPDVVPGLHECMRTGSRAGPDVVEGQQTDMSTTTTKDGTIYYKDWGKGPVITFSQADLLMDAPFEE